MGFTRSVQIQTQGKSHFVSSDMEDSGILEALTRLGQAGRVDSNRVLIRRSASNYTEQPRSMTAVQSMNSG
ncbi:purine nucleoside transporter [Gluconobacter frateurii M-2]|nr:purine nucleoside transporter [Gluconobacter frateurii M-2]